MPKDEKPASAPADNEGGVPVRFGGDPVHEYPEGIAVVVPPGPEDVPESSDSGSKSGQKAAPQKES